MAQTASPSPDPASRGIVYQLHILRGAEDQAAAYEAWLARWADVSDPKDDEQAWERIKQNLQQTRRDLGQRPLFPE